MKTADELQKELEEANAARAAAEKERDAEKARADALENPAEINLTVPAEDADFYVAQKDGVGKLMDAVEDEAARYGLAPEAAQSLFEERLDQFKTNLDAHGKQVEAARQSGIALFFGAGNDGEEAYKAATAKFLEGVDDKDMKVFVENGRIPKDVEKLTTENVGQYFAPAEIAGFLGKAGALNGGGAGTSVPSGAGNPPPGGGGNSNLGPEFSFTVRDKSGATRTLTLDPDKPEEARKILSTPIPGGTKVLGDMPNQDIQRARAAYFAAREKK